MFYVGLDIHCKHITMCTLNNDGKIVQRQTVRQADQMLRRLEELPGRFAVCYEASCGYGHYHELLTPLASRVVVAHPGLLRLIFRSKKKNDRNDAEQLAKLLYLDQVPTVHVPSADARAWRELIGYRRKLVQKRTRAKNGVRALLRTVGVRPPKRPGLWTRQGLVWLKAWEFSQRLHALKRDLLVEATWQAIRRSPSVRARFERFQHGDANRKKIALVATAHYLLRVMWSMLKNGTLWRETISTETA